MKSIGYDCKKSPSVLRAIWGQARRNQYLLDLGIDYPLSVDPGACPSFFEGQYGISLPPEVRRNLGLLGPPLPDWIGPHKPYWEDPRHFADRLHGLGEDLQDCMFVFVAQDDGNEDRATVDKSLFRVKRSAGFDVADEWFISALTNCGLNPTERKDLQDKYLSTLNEFHLISTLEDARRFAADSDALIPEHAPFYPYEIMIVGFPHLSEPSGS